MRTISINPLFVLFAVLILAACIVIFISQYYRLQARFEALHSSYRDLEKLNSELRSQRHDYLNHLQVVYGLIELEEYEELSQYLAPIYKDIMKTGKALKTSIPAVNALLKAKMAEAESRNIDFYTEVRSDLKNLSIEPWELCKVLSNLMDNAMTALESNEVERKLQVEIAEDKKGYAITVANNGPAIPKELQESIFREGFTTKKEKGHGMGLHIVMTVLKQNGGSLTLRSDEEETSFLVRFPKTICENKKGG